MKSDTTETSIAGFWGSSSLWEPLHHPAQAALGSSQITIRVFSLMSILGGGSSRLRADRGWGRRCCPSVEGSLYISLDGLVLGLSQEHWSGAT